MTDPVPMTMNQIASMWLDVGHKLQKRPPDIVTGYLVDGVKVEVGELESYLKNNPGQSLVVLVR